MEQTTTDPGFSALLGEAARPKHLYGVWDVEVLDGGLVRLGTADIRSKDLGRFLRGCERVVVLAATLGAQADGLLARLMHSDIARAVEADRYFSRLIESYVSEVQAGLCNQGKRYSPGYGDFSLHHQKDILAMLGGEKIGLYLTDSYMLVPSKSITAFFPLRQKGR